MNVQDLEAAAINFPQGDLDTFARWFEEYLADTWDRRLEADIAAGRLDEAGRRADAAFESAQLTKAQQAELERRLADSETRPDAVTPWDVVKARALSGSRPDAPK